MRIEIEGEDEGKDDSRVRPHAAGGATNAEKGVRTTTLEHFVSVLSVSSAAFYSQMGVRQFHFPASSTVLKLAGKVRM